MSQKLKQPEESNQTKNTQETPDIKANRLHSITFEHTLKKKAKYVYFDHHKKIQKLDFYLIGDKQINDYWLSQNKAISLHKWHTGQTLNICFRKTFDLSDNALTFFVKLLRNNFTKITSLSIMFVDCFRLTSKGIEALSQITRNLPNLKDLEIEFCAVPELKSKAAESLRFELIRNSGQVESFSLGLEDYNQLKHSDIELILLSISKYMKKLKRFVFSLSYSDTITNETIDLVAKVVSKNFETLQEFELRAFGCDVDENNLNHLESMLSFIPNFTFKTKWE